MDYLLRVKDLKKYFPLQRRGFPLQRRDLSLKRNGIPLQKSGLSKNSQYIKSVDGVSFDLREGETIGIVGESGCGKSTVGKTILRLYEPTAGEIIFNGENITNLSEKEMRKRRKYMQMIFQDPYSSLNPRLTAGEVIGRTLDVNRVVSRKDRYKRILKILDTVGLNSNYYDRYPGELSGGQRQRVGIARAIALSPKLIVCDEPISALDVSIQAQIINLLYDIQKQLKLSYVFITHNLAVVKHISDKIAVMYLGRIEEMGDREQKYASHLHPYTKALISAVLTPDPDEKNERIKLQGDVPSPIDHPQGCRFYPRCPVKKDICLKSEPYLKNMGMSHMAACHMCGSIE